MMLIIFYTDHKGCRVLQFYTSAVYPSKVSLDILSHTSHYIDIPLWRAAPNSENAVKEEFSMNINRGGLLQQNGILNGSIFSTILLFSVPIVLGNIFQQLYNLIDAIVVGRFLGDLPLAGISVAAPIMDIATALIIGSTIGIGVLIAQLYGAEDLAQLKITHSTALLGGVLLTVALSLAGIAGSHQILLAQGTDPSVCAQAIQYLRVVFLGMPFCFLYNYYASALRSCGNSRIPFYILLISSCLHIALDVLLVGVFKTGIVGIAFSTSTCQLFSAVWCMLYAHRHVSVLAVRRGEFKFSRKEAAKVLSYAWAAALQQSVVCIGRFLIQGMLTGLGTHTVTGYNMGMRVEQFAFCFSQGLSAAMVVCISQNMGRGNAPRARKFYRAGVQTAALIAAAVGIVFLCFPTQLSGMFSDHREVVASGAQYIGTMSVFYVFAFVDEMIQGFFRGIGRLRLTMVASFGQVLLRVILSAALIPTFGITGICLAVIAGWILLALIEGGYSISVSKSLTRRESAPSA